MASNQETGKTTVVSAVYKNTETNIIEITEDKLTVIINDFLKKYKTSIIFVPSLSIAISIFLCISSSEFNKSVFGLTGDQVEIIFWGLLIMSSTAFAITGIYALYNCNRITRNHLVCTIKNTSPKKNNANTEKTEDTNNSSTSDENIKT